MVSAEPTAGGLGGYAANGTAYRLTKPIAGDQQRAGPRAESTEPAEGEGAQHADQAAERRAGDRGRGEQAEGGLQ